MEKINRINVLKELVNCQEQELSKKAELLKKSEDELSS